MRSLHHSHMMLDAMTALLSLPRVISHRFNKSLMTVTKNLQKHTRPLRMQCRVSADSQDHVRGMRALSYSCWVSQC